MSAVRFFNIHRNWESILSMALGVVIGVSPSRLDCQLDNWTNESVLAALRSHNKHV